jgi:mannose-6-phosphate isomerase class I
MIWISAHRKPSTVFFNSSSGTTIAEAINVQHSSIFGIRDDVQHFPQHSYNVTINSHNSQLTLHINSHASDSGAVQQEGRAILGAKTKLLYNKRALSQKPLRIGHTYKYIFLL